MEVRQMKMTQRVVTLLLMAVLTTLPLYTDIDNPDRPQKGNWDFKIEKVQYIDHAGSDILGGSSLILVANDGRIYYRDYQKRIIHIFNDKGIWLKSFGPRGEGPGEIKQLRDAFLMDGFFIAVDVDRIHFFTMDGAFVKSMINNVYTRRPAAFTDAQRFISAPLELFQLKDGKVNLGLIDLNSGTETVLTQFSIFKGATDQTAKTTDTITISSLTPVMIVAYANNHVYYGKNDSYVITVLDLTGKQLNRFSLDREKKRITKEQKDQVFDFGSDGPPKDVLERIKKNTPDDLIYFTRIDMFNGLIYTFLPEVTPKNSQAFDIFSPEGRYLYQGILKVEDNLTILSSMGETIAVSGNHLYLVLEDSSGEIKIGIYKISLPRD